MQAKPNSEIHAMPTQNVSINSYIYVLNYVFTHALMYLCFVFDVYLIVYLVMYSLTDRNIYLFSYLYSS
jgi:hypothetical protein